MASGSGKPIVVFIGGAGRSGSTLLDRVLGQIEGVFSLGEVHHMWRRSFVDNQLCGCGEPFSSCEVWRAVTQDAYGGPSGIDGERVARLQRSVARIRDAPRLIASGLRGPAYRRDLREYAGILWRFYRSVARVTGDRILIDSSKNPTHGFVLSQIEGVELRVLNLVRDSRAVAFSWQRKKVRPEVHWKEELMPTYGILESSRQWFSLNALTQLLSRRARHRVIVRYEDLASNPRTAVEKLVRELEIGTLPAGLFVDEHTLNIAPDHTIAGNPVRFEQGLVAWKADTEWEERMPGRQRLAVAALTFPLLLRYGYLGRGRRRGSEGEGR